MRSRSHAPATLLLLGLSLAACEENVSAPKTGAEASALNAARAGEKLAKVVITTTDTTVAVNGTLRLTSRLDYDNDRSANGARWVTWYSLDTARATVSDDRVRGRAEGGARIVAFFADRADTLRLTVTAASLASDSTAADSAAGSNSSDTTPTDTGTTGGAAGTMPSDTGSSKDTTGSTGGSTGGTVTPPPAPEGPAALPELPRLTVDTRLVAPTGRRLTVRAGDRLQAVIDSARPGDAILIEPGSMFTGHFRLRRKSGDGWITISTASTTGLPAPGTRMTPSAAASARLPKIVTPDNAPAIATDSGAHHYRLIGLEVTVAPDVPDQGGLIALGGSGTYQRTLSAVPHHLIVDRSYVHGGDHNVKRCVTLNGAYSAVIDSYLSACHATAQDAQAILGWNGPGPFKIANNHLEGSGENIMFGGADPAISGLIPSDIEIRGNYVYKPASWKGVWEVKNSFELKNAQRVLVEGNVFDGNWSDAQVGFMWNIKSANQSGTCGWCVTQHLTARYNVLRNSGAGITVKGGEAYNGGTVGTTNHVLIAHNQLEKINVSGTAYTGTGRPFQLSGVNDFVVDHNTVNNPATSLLVIFPAAMGQRFQFSNNVGYKGTYGLHGLDTYAANAVVTGNAIVLQSASTTTLTAASTTTLYSTYGKGNVGVSSWSAALGRTGTDGYLVGADKTTLSENTSTVAP